MEEEVASGGIDGHVVVKGMVLTPLEGLKAVDDDLGAGAKLLHLIGVEQDAVTAEFGDLVLNG